VSKPVKRKKAILSKFNVFAQQLAAGKWPLPKDATIADLVSASEPNNAFPIERLKEVATKEARRLVYDLGEDHPELKYELMEIIEKHFKGV